MSLDAEPHPLECSRDVLNYNLSSRDIEYAYPKRSGLRSMRSTNPLNPAYEFGPSYAPPKPQAPAPTRRNPLAACWRTAARAARHLRSTARGDRGWELGAPHARGEVWGRCVGVGAARQRDR